MISEVGVSPWHEWSMIWRMAKAPIVIGVDPAASKVAFVAICLDEFISKAFTRLGKSGGVACWGAWNSTERLIDDLPWDMEGRELHAFVESPIVGRGGIKTTMVQCFTSGAVQGALSGAGFVTQTANVSSWKKHVVGKGNAKKEEVAKYLRLRHPPLFAAAGGNQDLIDASCIALYGQLVLRQRMDGLRPV